ncbi:hypothetical protein OXX80_002613 [Metschnikowia pulcherrima]
MPAYLNVETIKNAAELVNATLKTKGHIQEDLCFVTVDWESLIADQPEKDALERLTVQETIYNNDKNTVNAFYSLLQDLDRHNRQHEAANHVMAAKDAQIAKLERRLASAESEAAGKERKLARLVNIDSPALSTQIEHLEKKNRAHAREVTRLKNVNSELQNKYEVEKRRMAHEISELKSLILHSRGLSTTISYGRPLDMGKLPNRPRSKEPEVNPQIVHYNNPSINNVEPQILTPGASESSEIIKREYEGIATQLSELIERLMNENCKFARLTHEITRYMEQMDASITPEKVREENGPSLINPVHAINTESISADSNADVVPFEVTSTPLLKGLYRHYEAISTLVDMAVANTWENEALGERRKRDKLHLLQDENKSLSSSLQEALKALEEWRKLRKTTD